MTEPLSDDQLDLLRKIAARDWLHEGDDPYEIAATLHDLLPDLLAEVDQLKAEEDDEVGEPEPSSRQFQCSECNFDSDEDHMVRVGRQRWVCDDCVSNLLDEAAAGPKSPDETPHSVCPHVQNSDEGSSYCSLAERQVREAERQRDAVREHIDAIKGLNVTTNGDDQIHVDIAPLDPNPNAVNSVLLEWSLEDGWEHPPSGTSGTLGVMLHAVAVSALADHERGEETPRA